MKNTDRFISEVPQNLMPVVRQGEIAPGIPVEGQVYQTDRVVPVDVNDSWTPNPEAIARVSRVSAEEVGRKILELRSLRYSE